MITERIHAALLSGCDRLEKKHAEALLTKRQPVLVELAKELGLKVDSKTEEAAADAEPGSQVNAVVKLTDYIEAVRNYKVKKEDNGTTNSGGSASPAQNNPA